LPRFSTNFGRFEVAFDRPEFDRTQVLVVVIIVVSVVNGQIQLVAFLCMNSEVLMVVYAGR